MVLRDDYRKPFLGFHTAWSQAGHTANKLSYEHFFIISYSVNLEYQYGSENMIGCELPYFTIRKIV